MSAEMLVANLTAHWIQTGLLSVSVLLALRVMQVDEPRLKTRMLQSLLLLTLLLPGIQPWRPIGSAPSTDPSVAPSAASTTIATVSASQAASPLRFDVANLLLTVIIAGIIARFLWIAFGLLYVRQLLRTAKPIDTPEAARQLEPRLGVTARYVEHSRAAGPSTFGILEPTIVLPAGFAGLAPGFQRAVVCHELLHVKRRDTLVALLEDGVVAMFWFHPLIWIVRHQIRVAREQAVDLTVLDIVGDRSEYVRCLVELSGHDLVPHLSRSGAAMIRSRELRARVDAMFQEVRMSRFRRLIVSTIFVALMAMVGWSAATYAPLQATARAAQAPAASDGPRRQINTSYSEYPTEALEKGISGTVTVNITINPGGQVSTAAIVDGPPELRTSAFRAAMGLKYTPAPSTTSTTIYVEYRLDRQSWGVRIGERGMPGSPIAGPLEQARRLATGTYRVGNGIAAPKKIKDVPPVYPPIAQSAKVQGVVILEATVDETGSVSDVRVLRSIPLLDQAAIDAVKQWQYTTTLLNGQPVPIVMTVTVNFTLRGALEASYRLGVTLPAEMATGAPETILRISAKDQGVVFFKDKRAFAFSPVGEPQSGPVRIDIYDLSSGTVPPQLLGQVEVGLGGGIVYSATNPSFGIRLLGFESAPTAPTVAVP